MRIFHARLLLILIVLTGLSHTHVRGQEGRLVGEEPDVRTLIEKQQAEIIALRAQLQEQSRLHKEQTALIESLVDQVNALAGKAVPASAGDPRAAAATTTATAGSLPGASAVKKEGARQDTVESGFGKIKFDGLLQAGFAAADNRQNDTFRIRRAELKFTGIITPKVKWTAMFDLAKALSLRSSAATVDGIPVVISTGVNQSSRIFQEGYITYNHSAQANINVGQFKIPLSNEGLQSSAALDTIERALFLSDRSRGGGLGDARDLGLMAYGSLNKQFDYQIGIFNGVGESLNDTDQNEQKAVVGRLVFKPAAVKGLQVGGSGAFTSGPRTSSTRRDRLGAEVVFERDRLKLKSELMFGTDGDIHRRGFYSHIGYRFQPKLEAVFRYDTFDPDTRRETSASNAAERDYIGGLNYYVKGNNLKLQFNYIRKTFANRAAAPRNVFLVNVQTAW